MKQLLLFSVLSIFCLTISAQTNTWIGTDGVWSLPSNWSLNMAPTASHDVIIPAGSTVLLDVNGFTKSITVQGNAIFNMPKVATERLFSFTNASSFSAASTLNWAGCSMVGGGTLTLMGNTFISSTGSKFIKEGTAIINTGTLTSQDLGRLYIVDGILTNSASGVMDFQGAGEHINYSGSGGSQIFNNEGLIKHTGAGRVDIRAEFHNNGGTITVEEGSLRFIGLPKYMTNGVYNVVAGSKMQWQADIICAGTLTGVLDGGIEWGLGSVGKIKVPTGTTSIFNFTGDTGLIWTSGELNGSGTLTNLGKITMMGNLNRFIKENTTLNNEGLITFQESGSLYILGGTIINQTTGTIDMHGDSADILNGSEDNIIINYGLFKRTGTGLVDIESEFHNNNGTISVEGGILRFKDLPKYMTEGVYNVVAGSRMHWSSDIICAGTLTGVLDGELYISDNLNIPIATTATYNFTGNTGIVYYSGVLFGAGTLINNSKITMTGMNKHIDESTTLNNQGIINIESGNDWHIVDGTINNFGTIDLKYANGEILGSGAGLHVLNNYGLLKRSTTTGSTNIGTATTNFGTIDVQMGTLRFSGDQFNNTVDGKIMGVGTLNLPAAAAFTNDGIFSPGGYPGTLTANGDFKSSATSKLQIEIYGYTQGAEYDLLAVQGKANMDGDIPVALYFAPNVGDEFIVLTANSIPSCNLPATVTAHHEGHNYTFDVICNPKDITLKVSNIVLETEENTLSNLAMYPNPSNGHFTIDLGKEYADVSVQIYNMLGQTIASEKYASTKTIDKEITGPAGIYFVRVDTAIEGSKTLRIIKQ